MSDHRKAPSHKQIVFREMVLGTLLYAVVLGFFNDYTNILTTKSYSTTFAVAIVMQLLTYGTFMVKDRVVAALKRRESTAHPLSIGFGVWLVIFFSKFVFLWVIDVVFQQDVEISGFIGLLLIIITLTVLQKVVEMIYDKLGE